MPGSASLSFPPRAVSHRLLALVAVLCAAAGLAACGGDTQHAGPPSASVHGPGPETIFTPGAALSRDPTGTIEQMRALGVDRVRIFLHWNEIAPNATAARRPRFDATDPAAYSPKRWALYDQIIRSVLAHHMSLDVVLGGPPPRWAEGTGAPQPAEHTYWEPDAGAFEQFTQAVGTRYSGHYVAPGARQPLPRVSFWSIWNEPNEGVSLAPQATPDHRTEISPRHYRALADAVWTGLHRTGHGADTTLLGELAPVGAVGPIHPGNFDVMAPLRFLRALYCVGGDDTRLSGSAAAARGCPTTSAGSQRFAAENPVLFHATAFADHPYSFGGLAPNKPIPDQPDDADLGQINGLFTTLDKVQRAYGSSTRFPVYSTEYGYLTTPPGTQTGTVSPAEAAAWLNWGEYLTWRQPRLRSYDQYLLQDPLNLHPGVPYKGFASGIITQAGARKPGWYAFRMPVWLPQTSASKGDSLEVWGCARPAKILRASRRPPALVQWRAHGPGRWRTIARVTVRSAHGYFDVHERFPGSGQVRISWSPPGQGAIHSRVTAITVG